MRSAPEIAEKPELDMKRPKFKTQLFGLAALPFLALTTLGADLTSSYHWVPVRIGGGGYVTGFITHPQDAKLRYCRTDVAGAYRWDEQKREWINMLVRNEDGSGVPEEVARRPMGQGLGSIAIDPKDLNVVFMVFPVDRYKGGGVEAPDLKGRIYKSVDGGRNFARLGDLDVHAEPNGTFRMHGERLMVDPGNSKVLYYGSDRDGLWRSVDAGQHWLQVTNAGAPARNSHVLNVRISGAEGSVENFGLLISKTVYCDTPNGDVYASRDGGQTWKNISQGTALSGHTMQMVLAPGGKLFVTQYPSAKIWMYGGASWTSADTQVGGSGVENVAMAPANPARVFAIGAGGALARSLDGGKIWARVAEHMEFANQVGWTPAPGYQTWRSTAGIFFDRNGVLWCAQGDDGIVYFKPSAENRESAERPPKWTIQCEGIEEICMLQAVIPPGSGDKAFLAGMDEIGMFISDPDRFTAVRAMLNSGLSLTRDVDFVPNAPSVLVAASSDSFWTAGGLNYSGYSTDYARSWRHFPAVSNHLHYVNAPAKYQWPIRPLMNNQPMDSWGAKEGPRGSPKQPSDMRVSVVSESEVEVTWKRHSGNESGFRVSYWPYYARWAEQIKRMLVREAPPGGASLRIQGLIPNMSYRFTLSAYNDKGESRAAKGWELWAPDEHAGAIAVSRRGDWGTGADHIVYLPAGDRPPMFSKDGGASWVYSKSFPVQAQPEKGGHYPMQGKRTGLAPWSSHRPLLADPFVPDRFYLKFLDEGPEVNRGHWGTALWVSTDGGETWQPPKAPGVLPCFATLRANLKLKDDFWACGQAQCMGGQGHGVYHSKDGGATFSKCGDFDGTIQICLGCGSGKPEDAPYAVYVYGARKGDPRYGIFRSTDAGETWARISYYPAGNFNTPTSLGVSS